MSLKKQGTFYDDEEFIEIDHSPSRFNSSMDDEETPKLNKIKLHGLLSSQNSSISDDDIQ